MSAFRVLFDEPGPKARARIRITTAVTVLVLLGLLAFVLVEFGAHGQLAAERWTQFTELPILQYVLGGLTSTLQAAGVAAVVSIPAGALFSVLRLSRTRPVRWLATAYIEVFRSTPLLLLVYLFVGGLPAVGVNVPIFWKLVIPMILVNVAVLAEIFRAGVASLPKGQSEAGLSIGLTESQNLRSVVFPQAIRLVVPALVTQLVALLKDTTLGYAASYPELMKTATNLTAFTGFLIQTYLVIAFVYVVLNFLLSKLAEYLERRVNGGQRTARAIAQVVVPAE
jgi:glutamate transport system permease protein